MEDFKSKIAELAGHKAEDYTMAEILNNKFHRFFDDKDNISDVRSSDEIFL